jgi:hypothetical protein
MQQRKNSESLIGLIMCAEPPVQSQYVKPLPTFEQGMHHT